MTLLVASMQMTAMSVWMRMPGQSWAGATASFVGMWSVMMLAMMLPSAAPALWRYNRAVARAGGARAALLAGYASLAYIVVWTVIGMLVFPLGVALSAMCASQPALARAAPLAVSVVVVLAGAWQLTAHKARHLAGCRREPACEHAPPADAGAAWRRGVTLGLHCARCCANLMAITLVVGIMDLRAMAAVGIAITLERVAPAGDRVSRATGGVAIAVGLFRIVLSSS